MAEVSDSAPTARSQRRAKRMLTFVVIGGAMFRLAVFLHAKSLFGDEALRHYESLASLAATCTQRGRSFSELISSAARLPL